VADSAAGNTQGGAPDPDFTHLDNSGRAHMVDVTPKEPTHRRAVVRARVQTTAETAAAIADGSMGKGDVLAVARVAGIQAAKRTSELIPLCHPLMISAARVNFSLGHTWIDVEAEVETVERTGVEMEALVALQVALATIYDMCKAVDRGMTMTELRVLEKRGGKSGDWHLA